MKVMKKIMAVFIACLTITLAVPAQIDCVVLTVEAHSGRTDKYGGHKIIRMSVDWEVIIIIVAVILHIYMKMAFAHMQAIQEQPVQVLHLRQRRIVSRKLLKRLRPIIIQHRTTAVNRQKYQRM